MITSRWYPSTAYASLTANAKLSENAGVDGRVRHVSGAEGGTRTRTELPPRDFKSLASAIPPLRRYWRHHPDSDWGIKVLQTSALPLGYGAITLI